MPSKLSTKLSDKYFFKVLKEIKGKIRVMEQKQGQEVKNKKLEDLKKKTNKNFK